jgi:glycogen synthase
VHLNGLNLATLLQARRSHVPVIVSHQAFSPSMQRSLREPRTFVSRDEGWRLVQAQTSRIGMRLADRNVCVSHASMRALRPPRGVVIHSPARIGETFRPLSDVERNARFGFAGRLVVHKGCHVLLAALAECHRRGHAFGLDVYGDGPERRRLVKRAGRLGLDADTVTFHGFVVGEALARAFNRALAVVAPSVWHEPLGIVALEAMACGRAVVASDSGGLGEIVDGAGALFPPGDAKALAARLIQVYEEPRLRRGWEDSAVRRASRFTPEAAGGRYLALYRDVLANRGRRP